MPDHQIARLGLEHIPEGRGIFPALSVRENLQMASYTTDGENGSIARVNQLFPVLQQRRDQIAGTLSGGEQQMLSLARSIITKPKLLMVDELSLGLAPRLVAQLFDTLEKIKQDGTTILLVEQYVRYALRLADIVVILHKGRVAFIGEPGELAHEGKLVEAYLGGSQAESATAEAEEQGGPRQQRRSASTPTPSPSGTPGVCWLPTGPMNTTICSTSSPPAPIQPRPGSRAVAGQVQGSTLHLPEVPRDARARVPSWTPGHRLLDPVA